MPRLSILLPTRNGGNLLDHCLRSILDQDGDYELVVSDNANTDGTAEVLAGYRADPRLKIVRLGEPVPVV